MLDKWWTRWSGTADAQGWAVVHAFYGRHRVSVNGKAVTVNLSKAEGAKSVEIR